MSSEINKFNPGAISPLKPAIGTSKPIGLAAKRAEAEAKLKAEALAKSSEYKETVRQISPSEATDRIGIVFDDSGSMNGQLIEDAKAGVEEFLRSCKPNATAVAVHPMNVAPLTLSTSLPALALLVKKIKVQGSTPLLETLKPMFTRYSGSERLTRIIVFSDGSPNTGKGSYLYGDVIAFSKKFKISIDTVYIGSSAYEYPIIFMRSLAEDTGGIFLHFDPNKSNFRTAFKYLAPVNRLALTDKSFVSKLERGEVR